MAVNIGPRIGLTGEAEYRRALQEVIAQQKRLKAELKEAESGFDKNTSAMERAERRSELLRAEIEKQRSKVEQIERMTKAAADTYGEADAKTQRWQTALANAKTELNELNAELANNNPIRAWGQDIEAVGEKVSSLGDKLTTRLSAPIAAAGGAAIKSAIDYETAFTGVMKTVDETATTTYEDLSNTIKELSTTTASSKTDIAAVMEAAGQLGVSADDIEQFTRVMIELSDTTNLGSDEAAQSLARFLNITGDGFENVDRLGAAIVDLGNNFATDEARIVAMSTRLASAGTIAGMSATDILALATAMSSVGIEAEAGGTAMTQTLTGIGNSVSAFRSGATEALDDFVEVTGMTAEDFAGAWESSPITAVEAFIKGLDRMNRGGKDVNGMLDRLEMSGVRQSNMLRSLALASDVMSDAIETSSDAYERNTALSEEAEKRYNTSAAKISQLRERVSNLAITFGNDMLPVAEDVVDALADLVDSFSALDEEEREQIIKIAAVVAATGPALSIGGRAVTAIGKVTQGVGSMQAAVEGAGGVVPLVSSALSGMGASAGLVVAPLAALAAAMYAAGEAIREPSEAELAFADASAKIAEDAAAARKSVEDLNGVISGHAESVSSAGENLEILRGKLMECYDADGNLREGMEQTAQYILDELNAAMGTDYSTAFIAQAEDSAAALAEVNASIDQNVEAMKRQALQAVLMDDYTAAIKAQADAQKTHNEAVKTYRDALANAQEKQAAWLEAVRAGKDQTKDNTTEMVAAKAAYDRATEALDAAEQAMIDSTTAAREADAQVGELDRTMDLLAAGGTDAIDKAAAAYANVGNQAETAGKKAETMATTAMESARSKITETANKTAAELRKVGETKIPAPQIDAGSAINSARSARDVIQGFFNNNPITSFVHAVTRTVATREAYADGGFITEEQVARVGENGDPEVIIPLAPDKRRRAMELFTKTADILEADMATLPEPAGLSADRLYNAVKSGAEDAVMKVYLDDREVTRTLRGMGFKQ